MQYVFVSYFREDISAARNVVQWLKSNGVECFFDEDGLEIGDRWSSKIAARIAGASAFLFFLSRQYGLRPDSYVHQELAIADRVAQERDVTVPWFLTLRLDDSPLPRLRIGHLDLSNYHAVSAADSRHRDAMLARLTAILNDPTVTAATLVLNCLDLDTADAPSVVHGPHCLADMVAINNALPDVGESILSSCTSRVLMERNGWAPLGDYMRSILTHCRTGGNSDTFSPPAKIIRANTSSRLIVPAGAQALMLATLRMFRVHSTHGMDLGLRWVGRWSNIVELVAKARQTRTLLVRKTPTSGLFGRKRPTHADLYLTEIESS